MRRRLVWRVFVQRIFFVTAATVIVFSPLGLQHQADQHRREQDMLTERIQEVRRAYNQSLLELGLFRERNFLLQEQLQDKQKEMEYLEQRNRELEQILFNQRQTYRAAVNRQGSHMEILTPSSFTASMYERAWVRLGAQGLRGTGEALVGAEELHGVNSLVLAAIAYLESGGGMSRLAREKNNLFGLGAGGPTPFTSARSFASRDDCIYFAANLLRNSYLDRQGRYYYGDNLYAVAVRYAEDPLWAQKVCAAMALIAKAAAPEGR